MVGKVAALHADGVHFLYIFGNRHKRWHRSERLALKIHVKSCDDYSHAPAGELLAYIYDVVLEELSFVYTYYLDIIRDVEHELGICDGRGFDAVQVVGHYLHFRVPDVHTRFENSYFLVGELGSLESADKFFGLAGEH